MASLRARLLAALLALTAVGLLLLGGITYVVQRSFELDRIDRQASSALPAVAGALQGGEPRRPPDADGPPGGAPGSGLPPGTYGELRNLSGDVLRSNVFDYDQEITADPDLPRDIPLGRVFTAHGHNGDDGKYRVFADRNLRGDGITVVAVPLGDVDQRLNRLLIVEALLIVGVLLALGGVSWAVVRVGLLPLDRMGHTAGAIAGGDLSQRVAPTDPRTEVGRLGIALNAMLDRLEQAFSQREASENRLRRFIADASHELRTPLASIRGYAELFRMGAAREPGEVDKAMRRIEDEAARMGVLVEDLLTLARLDEVPDTPHSELDLAAIVRDAVDDGRAAAPGREIRAQVDGPALVVGDPDQLRQVLGNLLRNAFVHTPQGTLVEVTLEQAGGEVRVEVRDHGPGLPTSDAEALFERFWRSEGGRERGRGGAGLGLAIVAAIVDAHRGDVRAGIVPDGGATFVVTLPGAR